MAKRTFKSKATIEFRFSDKHKTYIRKCRDAIINIAEGAVRSGKTTTNVFAFAQELKTTTDKLHLATGSTVANAMLNIGDTDGHGLEHIFRGQSHYGKYKGNACLFIKGPATGNKQRIVIFAGGALANSFKKIRGNSYGIWIATEINLHHDSFIKEAFNRQLAAQRRKIFWDLNPDHPKANIYATYIDKYAKQFKDGEDIGGFNYEHFTIHDNINIPEESKRVFINQYDKTSIWYLRDILGQRCVAEGLIYRQFATRYNSKKNKAETITVAKAQELIRAGKIININIGVDFGGNLSGHAFVATATTVGYKQLLILASEKHLDNTIDPDRLGELFTNFVEKIIKLYGFVTNIYADSAETVLINGLRKSLKKQGYGCVKLSNAKKIRINDRIYVVGRLMGQYRLLYVEDECTTILESLSTTIWNPKVLIKNERLDDGTIDIDSQDAFEYTIERDWKKYVKTG